MKKYISLFLIITFMVGLCACTKAPKKFTNYSFDYFDTVTTIVGYEQSEKVFNQNCQKIKDRLAYYHKLYDIYTVYENINNLCKINMSQGKALTVEQEIIELLEYSKKLYSLTDGQLNIAMGSVLSIWHDYRESGLANPQKAALPDFELLSKANKHTDIGNIIINQTDRTVTLKGETKIDVGGIAKGFTAQKIAEYMAENGIDGYILNIGGNVKTVGLRPDGEKWSVGIENPDTKDTNNPYIELLEIADLSLVTSGSYQRFYTVNGKDYNHIINPKTLYPADNFKSVSVLCKDSALADALSTALFCMPYTNGKVLAEKMDVHVMWVMKNGDKKYTSGFKSFIKN